MTKANAMLSIAKTKKVRMSIKDMMPWKIKYSEPFAEFIVITPEMSEFAQEIEGLDVNLL